MLHQQSLLQTRLHHNVKNLWLKIRSKNEKENSLSSGPIAAFKKIPFAPMEAVAGSFIQIPPLGDLVKAAAAIGPGAGEWSKKQSMSEDEKHKNP